MTSLPHRRRVLPGAAIALLLAACGGGSGSNPSPPPPPPPPPPLGTATLLSSPCTRGLGSVPGATCVALRITGAAGSPIPAIDVELRVLEPSGSVPLRGTVLFGSGGTGVDFYGDNPGGPELFQSLLALGFRVVDRAWVTGWFLDGADVKEQSRRYAILLDWVRANLHGGGVFCATGNSGGSAEIAYALTTWDRASQLDGVVLSSGPPMSRIDYLCFMPTPSAWTALCPTLVANGVMTCGQPACVSQQGNALCPLLAINSTAEELEATSILHPGAALDYPSTVVHALFGTDDCSEAAPQGLLYVNAITSQKAIEFVLGAPHWLPQIQAGRDAIQQALAGIALPVTLGATATPQVGGTLQLSLWGRPGAAYEVFASASTMPRPLASGWSLEAGSQLSLGTGLLDAVRGNSLFTAPVPADPALAGLVQYHQAIAAGGVSNVVRVVIGP